MPITLEQIRAAYARHQLTPCYGSWGTPARGTACPLTALCFDELDLRAPQTDNYGIVQHAADILETDAYAIAEFVSGIDGRDMNPNSNPTERAMHELGRQARLDFRLLSDT